MFRKKYTYQINRFIVFTIIFEFIFWIFLWQLFSIFGAFSPSATSEKLTFLSPHYAWLLPFIVFGIIGIFIYQLRLRNRRVKKWGNPKTIETFMIPVSTKRIFLRFFFIRNTLIFTLLALMQPAFGTKTAKGTVSDMELIFAVDVSNSMNTRDMENNESRISVAKRAMNQLINNTNAAQIGIVIFAGNAYPQLPLTMDYTIAKMYIDELKTSLISKQGTHIASALTESVRLFSNKKNKKILVLITDGEDHEGGIVEAYSKIDSRNIEIFILGLGSENGGIVLKNDYPNSAVLKDDMNQAVVSKVNKQLLQEIGKEINGFVIVTNNSFPNLSGFLTLINSKSTANTIDLMFTVKKNRYQLPLSLALLSLLVLFLLEIFPIKNK